MGDHVVRSGECIASIAFAHGLFWQTVWNDDANAELRKLRGNPNVLLAGDHVFVHDLRAKSEEIATGATHRFRRKGVPATLKVQIMHNGKPRAQEPYRITIDGVSTNGVTDIDGNVQRFVMPNAVSGTLSFAASDSGPAVEYALALRQLDPASEPSGQQARLSNLGLYHGAIDGAVTQELRDALGLFQRRQGLTETGEADDTTLQALMSAHGC